MMAPTARPDCFAFGAAAGTRGEGGDGLGSMGGGGTMGEGGVGGDGGDVGVTVMFIFCPVRQWSHKEQK